VREYRELENKKVETAPVQQEEVVDETHQGNTNVPSQETLKLSTGIAWIDEASVQAIKQFTEKYPEADIQQIIKKVQKSVSGSRTIYEDAPDAAHQVEEVLSYLESNM
jgi:hypothetical protein